MIILFSLCCYEANILLSGRMIYDSTRDSWPWGRSKLRGCYQVPVVVMIISALNLCIVLMPQWKHLPESFSNHIGKFINIFIQRWANNFFWEINYLGGGDIFEKIIWFWIIFLFCRNRPLACDNNSVLNNASEMILKRNARMPKKKIVHSLAE